MPVVARQAARLAAGKGLRGKHPKRDVSAHAAQLAQARYVAQSLRYLSGELHRLLEVVVLVDLPAQGVMPSSMRHEELATLLVLLDELRQVERRAVTMLMELIGFPTQGSRGILTSGGSMANLICLAAARHWYASQHGWSEREEGCKAALTPHWYCISRGRPTVR